MQQNTVIAILEEEAPPAFAADWDKSGIQVASARPDVTHLAVSLDPTPDAVADAAAAGADMLLTHHPLTLRPRYPDTLDVYQRALSLLLCHDMPLYAAHTTLDANPAGPAAWLPDELNLRRRELLEVTGVLRRADGTELTGGFGCVGDLPAPLALPDLVKKLAALLPLDRCNTVARLIGDAPALIRRVAVCTGSGAQLADRARALGADLYITGDVKYHDALDLVSRNRLPSGAAFAVLDVGHFALEEEMTRRLALNLTRRLPDLRVSFLPRRDPFCPFSLPEVPEVLS
ncbi:MAG: Nif3-like dinuclear metal center hexameric protein [Desulfovibrionaceae bacterium]|nr:Nif3-like dinuclear metal center hexameric protein [Desulfovibrionaceae bacterium]